MSKKLPKFNDLSYIHFITTNTNNRFPFFKDDELCQILADNIEFYEKKFNLEIYSWVIMPDHLHLLAWWDGDKYPKLTISKIMQGIKGSSARQIIDYLKKKPDGSERRLRTTKDGFLSGSREPLLPTGEPQFSPGSHKRNLKYQIWQPDFYDYNIDSDYKLNEKINYIIENPIRAGLVTDWQNYKWLYLNKDFDG
ncbi:MAG: hypothetical protein A2663_00085 [Candidatus Buchananbacteria bacterium RIFCSPHIGHO2_01_FULL_46_12]|uniref:Transposase IS200-like domain-containing protein n=2 Tax=Candidatus Buchananiibacteriota TaxID=1817903 RepID=A0A1G1YNE1_9BACT|nr:MAG: hypothetical protein A2663_00085 [Candidatus Buchananbacteria bacterium RIFCSPHIGHO2_01_FULL_46_12]OGY53865.1 MAG: hypothetical protein A3B15_02025 [Candidatus Buchananbacteria bacterium RIFCSPLOWO2_01_FULL_45_31]